MTLNAEWRMPFNNLRVISNAIEHILAFGDASATLYFLSVRLGSGFVDTGNYEFCNCTIAERTARKVASISC
jgi:hypothetical protein